MRTSIAKTSCVPVSCLEADKDLMMAIYPEVARDVIAMCEQYRRAEVGEEQLQRCLWSAHKIISAIEERELSDFFRQMEGKIELLRFTVNAASVRERVLRIVEDVERRTKEYLSSAGTP